MQILYPRQHGLGHFQHTGASLVGGARLRRRERVQRRATSAVHALDHAAHGGAQVVVVDMQVGVVNHVSPVRTGAGCADSIQAK